MKPISLNDDETSKIIEFFRDSTVFLTGGTGFIGKVIINKLFSICQVSRVYLLIRKKASKCSSERLQELLKEPVILHLKSKIPDLANRIILVEGDCSLENLGLCASDEKTLRESVNFVIHGAASMNLQGSLKTSVEINIRGTVQLVNLAKKMVKLKTFVFLSSLGGFLERSEIDEKLYELHLEYEDLLNLLKIDEVLRLDEQYRKKIIGNKITMYSLTKAAAENIFIREEISVPVVIFRFSLALPCLKEPFAGWIDGFYGPSGAFALPLLNIFSASYWISDFKSDGAPADFIVNALIAATQYSYQYHTELQTIEGGSTKISPSVYNYCHISYPRNAVSIEAAESFMKHEFRSTHRIYSNKFIFLLRSILFDCMAALIIDFFLVLFGEKFKFFRVYRSMLELNLDLASAIPSPQTNMNNIQNCYKSLNNIDRELFPFDLDEIVWNEYLSLFANSVREYLRTLFENNPKIRFMVFWIPKVRLALKVLYCALGLHCIYMITLRLINFDVADY